MTFISFYYIFVSNGSEEDMKHNGGVRPRSSESVVWPDVRDSPGMLCKMSSHWGDESP